MSEIYSLGNDRSAEFAKKFLDNFMPLREPAAEDYSVPELQEPPSLTLQDEDEILTYLEQNPTEPYGIYWNAENSTLPSAAMIFYTNDGKAIYGLVTDENGDELLKELSSFVDSQYNLCTEEERPPQTSQGFIALCKERS